MATLLQIILQCVDSHLEQMNSNNGAMLAGHNGPYHDPETPVRNTGHWLISFSRAYEWTGDEKYINAVRRCADYLFSKPARPFGFSFHHRNNPSKDHCNGLVGQAWTFEALAETTRLFSDQSYAHLAEEVFFQHPFNWKSGLWNRLEIDGRTLTIDGTFNHQLWFAACASLIECEQTAEIGSRVERFMDCLPRNLTILDNGLVYHPIERSLEEQIATNSTQRGKVRRWSGSIIKALRSSKCLNRILTRRQIKGGTYRSVGYHSFNMYAFAILKTQFAEHSFWDSTLFKKAVDYMLTAEYGHVLNNNKFGYPYNPPGFEVPYSLGILTDINEKELTEISQWWINEQFKRCYNRKTCMMDRDTEDILTHSARIYELCRLPINILRTISI